MPLVVGSEGTLAIVTSARLRLHPAPTSRGFGAWSFPTTAHGLEAMRAIFQAGLRPAVARLYDPFDAMLAKRGGVKARRQRSGPERAPGRGGAALRAILKRPALLNELLHSGVAARALGGAMLVVVFEGSGEGPLPGRRGGAPPRRGAPARIVGRRRRPRERWLEHRYAVSYRQAPVFANGAFVDTMEVAASLVEARRALRGRAARARRARVRDGALQPRVPRRVLHLLLLRGQRRSARGEGGDHDSRWDDACEAIYDRAWRAALEAAVDAGGTLAHHHGVGRSKAPRLPAELGAGVDVVRALMHAFDPAGILNPGNLVPGRSPGSRPSRLRVRARPERRVDDRRDRPRRASSRAASGRTDMAALERQLGDAGLTLDAALRRARSHASANGSRAARPERATAGSTPSTSSSRGSTRPSSTGELSASVRRRGARSGPTSPRSSSAPAGRFGRIDARLAARARARDPASGERPPSSTSAIRALSSGEAALLDDVAAALTGA